MRRPVLALATLLTCSVIFLAGPAALSQVGADEGDAKSKAPAMELFGLTRVINLHIEIAADEYQAMQPVPPAGVPGAPPPAVRPNRPGARRASGTSLGSSFRGCAGRCLRKVRRTKVSPSGIRETPRTWPRRGA